MAKIEHNPLEHAKLIGKAIDRMANNHTKWLLTLFTVIGFTIAMDKFLWDLTPIVKLISYILTGIMLTIFTIMIALTSKKYFNLEVMFRQKQKKILNGEINSWDMNPNNEYDAIRNSWIFIISYIIISLFILSQLAFIILGSLQVAKLI